MWPKQRDEEVIRIDTQQLEWLLGGYDIWRMKPHVKVHYSRISWGQNHLTVPDTFAMTLPADTHPDDISQFNGIMPEQILQSRLFGRKSEVVRKKEDEGEQLSLGIFNESEVLETKTPEASPTVMLKVIGEDVSEQIDVIPAQIRVIRTIRKKYACPHCVGHVKRAPLPKTAIPKSMASAGLLAYIATSTTS